MINITKLILLLLIPISSLSISAQIFSDQASNYGGNWSNGSNSGTGFGPWVLSSGNNTGRFIGSPSNDGMNNSGIGGTAFGLFATSSVNYASAFRPLTESFEVGDELSFFWSINWDSNAGNKGFDLRVGNTTVFNMNNAGSANISSTNGTASPNYGVNTMKVTILRMSTSQYLLTMNRRFNAGGDFVTVINNSGMINGINFYIGAQGSPDGERNLYFNRLQLEKGVYSASAMPNFVIYRWSGALTPTSIKVNAKLARTSQQARLMVSTNNSMDNPIYSEFISVSETTNFLGSFSMVNLIPDTQYFYTIEADGIADLRTEAIGRFKTAQTGAHSFSFTAGACNNNIVHPVFNRIKEKNPLFMMMHGDLHYMDPNSTNVNVHRRPYEERVLSMENIRNLYKDIPIAYMWDDHDFSGNDSNASSIGAESAKQAYREYVPHYPFATGITDENTPIYQSFVIGRVRFIMTDIRSENVVSGPMSASQVQWFKDECLEAKAQGQMICWVSSFGITADNSDSWGGTALFRQQRNELFTFLNNADIRNLFVISGDAHAIGIDDGQNTDCAGVLDNNTCPRFECSWAPRYPLFQVAPLGNTFTVKGVITNILPMTGINQHGQYGKIDITDDGAEAVTITFTAYRVHPDTGVETQLATYSFTRNLQDNTNTNVFVPSKSEWKYLDNGSNQGTNWKEINFDDTSWAMGSAPLGYNMIGIQTPVSFGPDAQNKYITTYFRKSFNLTETATIVESQLNLWLDDGAVAYWNGVEIAKANFNHQTWNYLTLATGVVTNQPALFRFCLSELPVQIGQNVLAIEVHQHSGQSSDKYFDAQLTGRIDSTLSIEIPEVNGLKVAWLKLYPNPTSGLLQIMKVHGETPMSWIIYDLNGRTVYKGKFQGSNEETQMISFEQLPTGIYQLEIKGHRKSETFKIVKR